MLFALGAVALYGGAGIHRTGARLEGEASATAERTGSTSRRDGRRGAPSAASDNTSPWVIEDRPDIELEGLVLADGMPAADVSVRLEDATRERRAVAARTTRTGGDGRFRFEAVAPIHEYYRLVASTEGASPAWVYVPGDESKDDITLGLRTCRFFAYGTVRDASGGPLESARVFLDAVPESTILTDADGAYRLCVPERSAIVRVQAEGYGTWSFRIDADGSERHDATLMPEGALSGVVVLSGGEHPVADAIVGLWSGEGELVTEVMSDAAGRFEARHLAPGTYTIRARARRARFRQPVHATVLPGETAHVVVPVDARARVTGVVRERRTPVAGARVRIYLSATEQSSADCTTAPDGTFVLEDVPVGTANVSVFQHEVLSPETLQIPEEGLTGLEVRVQSQAELEVTVLRAGRPVQGARVRATSPGDHVSARSDGRGVATLEGLRGERYRVLAEHDGAFAIAENVVVARDERATLSLELAPGIAIEGVVIDTARRAIDGARVSLTPVSSSENMGASAVTDTDGAFRGGPLRGPATYRVAVHRNGVFLPIRRGAPDVRVTERGAPSPSRLTIVVDPQDHTLEGTVIDSEGLPIPDTRVSLFPPLRHTAAVQHTYTSSDGAFVIRDVGAGPFRLRAVAPSGTEAELDSLALPHAPVTIVLGEAGALEGTLEGFRRAPVVMAWTQRGYDWESLRYAAIDGDRFTFDGLAPGEYYLAASTNEQATTVEVSVAAGTVREVRLVASGTRTVRGRHVDLVSGTAIGGASCQAAPYIEGARSPVVVPGAVRTSEDGSFELRNVPTADLYAWCLATERSRGGVGRIPRELSSGDFTVYGLDVTGRPPLDPDGLGFTFDDDRPFSRAVATIEPDGPAARSGLAVGDVIARVGPTPVAEVGNGTTRLYIALLLTETPSVPIVIVRGGALVERTFSLRR